MHTSLRAIPAMLLLLMPSIAFAHAQLRQAEPPVGAVVHIPPAQVELTFSETVEPRFSAVMVTDVTGAQMDKHDLHATPGDTKRLAISLIALPPGVYKVVWHATSVDTHKTEGTFIFTVAP
jgi:methionine-rich copper-binding protein CopC